MVHLMGLLLSLALMGSTVHWSPRSAARPTPVTTREPRPEPFGHPGDDTKPVAAHCPGAWHHQSWRIG